MSRRRCLLAAAPLPSWAAPAALAAAAVPVVSAVEGVQPQTPLLFRALQRLHVPTLIFVNKIDRTGADAERVLSTIARRLSPGVVPMGPPLVTEDDHRAALAEVLAEHDETIGVPWFRG